MLQFDYAAHQRLETYVGLLGSNISAYYFGEFDLFFLLSMP